MGIIAYIVTIVFSFPYINKLSTPLLERLPLSVSAGPVCFAFDVSGEGPYTTVADGRILKYQGPDVGFVEYAYTSQNRTREICDGTNSTATIGPICGRPLGLEIYQRTGELYVVDAFYGLLVVKPEGGGRATQLATSADGVNFGAADGLEVDQLTGIVYFTDASSAYNMNQFDRAIAVGDSSGRVLKYDPQTGNVTVLLSGVRVASGVAVSNDSSYLLVTENLDTRVLKYWLNGPRANTVEVLLNITGGPNKIRRTERGDFWIAVTRQTTTLELIGQRIDGLGNTLETVFFNPQFDSSMVTEVYEYNGALYLGSMYGGYVGVYNP